MKAEREACCCWWVSRTAGSGSRNPEMEAERLYAKVSPAESEDDEKALPLEEAAECRQEGTIIEEVTAGKDVPSTEMEGCFVMYEIEGEQQLVRVKAPPQKRRAVIRVESAETQDCISEKQGLQDLVKKKRRNSALF